MNLVQLRRSKVDKLPLRHEENIAEAVRADGRHRRRGAKTMMILRIIALRSHSVHGGPRVFGCGRREA